MRYKVDLFHDETKNKYAATEFVEAGCKEHVKPTRDWFSYYKVEEDDDLKVPAIFYASITHDYSDGYDCDHTDYIKTIYVQATSYKEGTEKLNEKFRQQYKGIEDYSIGRVYKDDRDPLTILLSK